MCNSNPHFEVKKIKLIKLNSQVIMMLFFVYMYVLLLHKYRCHMLLTSEEIGKVRTIGSKNSSQTFLLFYSIVLEFMK